MYVIFTMKIIYTYSNHKRKWQEWMKQRKNLLEQMIKMRNIKSENEIQNNDMYFDYYPIYNYKTYYGF